MLVRDRANSKETAFPTRGERTLHHLFDVNEMMFFDWEEGKVVTVRFVAGDASLTGLGASN